MNKYSVYVCPNCHVKLDQGNGLSCSSCGTTYNIHYGIPDLYYDKYNMNQTSKDEINSQTLYKSVKDLETRINYFKSRFNHSLDFSKIGEYLENAGSKVYLGTNTCSRGA